MSSLFVHTLREDPADAEVASHKLLIRAGYIRPVGPGLYSWLPLGLKVLRRIEAIIRQEMDQMGAQEILFPALLPAWPYQKTHRWEEYGQTMFRLKDRRDNDYLLGPTHEELFTLIIKDQCHSYKDLPITLYQIQTKYRDEARPRSGLLRCREFIMKDSYSFDLDEQGLAASYQAHRQAYQRIFDRLGIRYVIVSAVSGAMGGSSSEEFLAESPIGEDTFVRCVNSAYAANVEAVITPAPDPIPFEGIPPTQIHDTGPSGRIEDIVQWAQLHLDPQISATDTLKTIALKIRQPGGDWELLGIGLPGDRDVDEKRLAASLEPAEYCLLTDEDFKDYPFLVKGFIGPQAFLSQGIRYLVDPRVGQGTRWISGADCVGKHYVNYVAGRDFIPDGTIEAATICEGDPSPDGAGPLVAARGIEIGHIFSLGSKYTDVFETAVLGVDGRPVRLTMGSYGIGVSRLVAVIAEQYHDEFGLRWPCSVAPFDYHLVIANKDPQAQQGAWEIANQLDRAGADIVVDDRSVSPGVKFKDAELLGVPYLLIFGRRFDEGYLELRNRFDQTTTLLALQEGLVRDLMDRLTSNQ